MSNWLPSDSSELELLEEAPLSDGRFLGCASTLTQPRSSAALSSSRDIGVRRSGATRTATLREDLYWTDLINGRSLSDITAGLIKLCPENGTAFAVGWRSFPARARSSRT